jgi:tRNA G46 methylase TrmB
MFSDHTLINPNAFNNEPSMKVRESGMPPEDDWESFFNVELILRELLIDSQVKDLVEIGCGYGTFTIPVARLIQGWLYAFDLD